MTKRAYRFSDDLELNVRRQSARDPIANNDDNPAHDGRALCSRADSVTLPRQFGALSPPFELLRISAAGLTIRIYVPRHDKYRSIRIDVNE